MSRLNSVARLTGFLQSGNGNLQRVRGVARIGKSRVVSTAYTKAREELGLGMKLLHDREYRYLNAKELRSFLDHYCGQTNGQGVRRGRLLPTHASVEKFRREFNGFDRVVICMSARGVDSTFIELLHLLSSNQYGKPELMFVIEERSDIGVIGFREAMSYISVVGFLEDEARRFVRERFGPESSMRDDVLKVVENLLVVLAAGHCGLLDSCCEWLRSHIESHGTVGDARAALAAMRLIVEDNVKSIVNYIREIVKDVPYEARQELISFYDNGDVPSKYALKLEQAGLMIKESGTVARLIFCWIAEERAPGSASLAIPKVFDESSMGYAGLLSAADDVGKVPSPTVPAVLDADSGGNPFRAALKEFIQNLRSTHDNHLIVAEVGIEVLGVIASLNSEVEKTEMDMAKINGCLDALERRGVLENNVAALRALMPGGGGK